MKNDEFKISIKNGEIVIAILLMIIGVFFLITANNTIPENNIAGQPGIGPRAFPVLACWGLIITSAVLIISRLVKSKYSGKVKIFEKEGMKRVILAVVGLIVYYFVTPHTGFIISSIVYLLFIYWVSGYPNKKLLVLLAVLVNLIVYFVFQVLLNVPLP